MLELTLYNAAQHVQLPLVGGRMVLGTSDGLPLAGEPSGTIHATLETTLREGCERLAVTNRGQSIVLPGGQRILPGMSRELDLPAEFWMGRTNVYVRPCDSVQSHDAALTVFPRLDNDPARFAAVMKKLGGAPSSHTLAYWLDALGRLQRSPAGTEEFFAAAAYALFDPGGLDSALILLRDGGSWRIAASYVSRPHPAMAFRRTILDRVVAERQTLFHDARAIGHEAGECPSGFAVAAPVCDASGEVMAVVYGSRFHHAHNNRRGIRPLEAQFVQAVADAVAAGLTRLERESKLVRLMSRLELAFSPSVARELERNPRLLEGDQREVTILFADLRGFTSLSERLSPRESYALLGDVMDRFTHEVMSTGGVLIDYFGDGLAAFWNAPLPQADHALLACQTAMRMCAALPEISEDWYPVTGRHLRLGIGIHTAITLVGNAGSRSRIKYGPRGSAMNLASRVQTATKQLGLAILVTQSTSKQLTNRLPTRRVARLKLDGFAEPVDLFQPLAEDQLALLDNQDSLDEALTLLDRGQHCRAAAVVRKLQDAALQDPAVDHLARLLQ
jgi:adenylate cyclase